MNPQIPLKFRLIAAGLHAIFPGLIGALFGWLAAQLLGVIDHPIHPTDPHNKLIDLSNLAFGASLILYIPIIIWICWLITRRIHDTIDIAGQDAINCALNNMIAILAIAFVFGTTCGVFNIRTPLATNIYHSSLVIFDLVAIVYATNSIIFCIFTLRGSQFNNRFIYQFIRNE